MSAYILFFQVCMYTGELQGKCYQVGPIRAQDEASCKDGDWTGKPCEKCKGAGEDDDRHRCSQCGGTGDQWMTWQARAEQAEAKNRRLVEALEKIERWFGDFPETGQFWDVSGTRPMSYGACYGSNGERDFMRKVAREALAERSEASPDQGGER